MDIIVNQALKVPFTSVALATGRTTFSPVFLNNGLPITITPTPTFTEVGSGVYTVNFVPAVTGEWTVFIEGAIQAKFTVVTKSLYSILTDISDESLGSWTWDKNLGLLTLLRSDSTTLATYTVVDTLAAASRARLT